MMYLIALTVFAAPAVKSMSLSAKKAVVKKENMNDLAQCILNLSIQYGCPTNGIYCEAVTMDKCNHALPANSYYGKQTPAEKKKFGDCVDPRLQQCLKLDHGKVKKPSKTTKQPAGLDCFVDATFDCMTSLVK
eukprot:NODE_312_length_10013_cov_0.697801.p6 type:complete len:133 gc:universal NODE_312_length_10013_cov_0.697801:9408-9806(+)